MAAAASVHLPTGTKGGGRAGVTALRLRRRPSEQTRSLFPLLRVLRVVSRQQIPKRSKRPPKNDPPGEASPKPIRRSPPQHREVTVNGASSPAASDKRCKRREGKRSVRSFFCSVGVCAFVCVCVCLEMSFPSLVFCFVLLVSPPRLSPHCSDLALLSLSVCLVLSCLVCLSVCLSVSTPETQNTHGAHTCGWNGNTWLGPSRRTMLLSLHPRVAAGMVLRQSTRVPTTCWVRW